MKRIITLGFILTGSMAYNQSNVLRLTLNSHNEMNDPFYGVNYTDAQDWTDVKTKLNMLVDTLEFYQAKYNLQCESNFILANMSHESAASSSTDFLESMENHALIEVDPHNHMDLDNNMNPDYNPYNYADLVKLLDSTGITRATTVGGYIYLNSDWAYPTNDNWTNWDSGITGNYFPNYSWTPTVLWGGGTANHVNDPFALGLWRPAGPTALTFDDPSTTNLPAIGNGCEWVIQDVTDIDAMVSDIQTHVDYFNNTLAADPNMFISGSVVFNLRYILTPGYIEKVCELIRKLNPMVQSGDIIWQNIYEKYQVWNTAHPNTTDHYILFCDDLVGLGDSDLDKEVSFEVYPNPSNGNFTLDISENGKISFYDLTGKLIFENTIQAGENLMQLENLNAGVYLLKFENEVSSSSKLISVE